MSNIKIHTANDFHGMRAAGKLAAETLDFITSHVCPGVSTGEINDLCHAYIIKHGATPAPLGYRGFPKSICTSINHVVCHGIPDNQKKLKNGDVLNIDVTVILDEWHGDTSRMYYVGDKISLKARRLIDATYQAMMRGIEEIRPSKRFGCIGQAIQKFAEAQRYSVVRDFCGHGLGRKFHDAPNVLHYGHADDGAEFQYGMFFTVEPMINIGTYEVLLMKDGWTAITRDRQLSAQFEHSLGISKDGVEIFTLSPKGWHYPPYE